MQPPSHLHRPSVRFVVPWRTDGGERQKLWAFCRSWWEKGCSDFEVVEGQAPEGPFSRAAAINDGAQGDWEVAVVLDADVLATPDQVAQAVSGARATGRLTLAFERFVGLIPSMTNRILEGYQGDWTRGRRYVTDEHESSIVAVPRALWDEIGGFDERFRGWGQEDVSFVQAARVLGGWIDRVPGTVYHLWHRRSPDRMPFTATYKANQELGARYRQTRDPEAMRALLSERRVYA